MSSEVPKINITPRPEKVIRDEKKHKKENLSLIFSGELENEQAAEGNEISKRIEVYDKERGVKIGSLKYNVVGDSIKINEVIRDLQFSGNEIGLNLYKELIRIAKNQNLRSIRSDCVIQGGALAVWKNLRDEGYVITINPLVTERYERFLEAYNDGRYFKELLEVPPGESVFELFL